jgi:archaellum component FlaF (FlaF/FlaG flagellin family)
MINVQLKNRKGVNTVVSTILLIAIVASLCTTIWVWSTTYLNDYQTNAQMVYTSRSDALKESFIIENVWFNSNTNVCSVAVRNVGLIGIVVTEIDLDGTIVWQGENIVETDSMEIIDAYCSWDDGYYIVSVFTNRGNEVTEQWHTLEGSG